MVWVGLHLFSNFAPADYYTLLCLHRKVGARGWWKLQLLNLPPIGLVVFKLSLINQLAAYMQVQFMN